MTSRGKLLAAIAAAAAAIAAVPATASAQGPGAGSAADETATTSAVPGPVRVDVVRPKRPVILQGVLVKGAAPDADADTRVRVIVRAGGRKVLNRLVNPVDGSGTFQFPMKLTGCCKYVVSATRGDKRAVRRFKVTVPKSLKTGPRTRYFHKLLRKQGFHVDNLAKRRNWSTDLAIKAFRKTNGMGRSHRYSPAIYRKLASGRGAFKPKERKKGRYVEVDISRQVMALINNGKAVHTFHVSTGASSTPTIRGHFRFYLRQAGYNSKRMYYSVYFIRGYATHGFDPVPDYPASHGCVRNPIPYSRFIYNWVQIGMPIYTYL